MNKPQLLNVAVAFLAGVVIAVVTLALTLPTAPKSILPPGEWDCYQPISNKYQHVSIHDELPQGSSRAAR